MKNQFPAGRTALLVIHGIGEQNPLETLDSFSRGFMQHLAVLEQNITASHRIKEQKGASGAPWTESYVRIQPASGDGLIDIHEYYWAYLTEEKITIPEVWAWVEQALAGTRKFYDENRELRRRFESNGTVSYRLNKVMRLLYLMSIFHPAIKLLIPVLQYFSRLPIPAVFTTAAGFLLNKLHPVIVGFIGDVAIYTTTDAKSRFYDIRNKILAESLVLVESLLRDDTYDRVIVAGHSLGSVIAFDTLNRLNIAANQSSSQPLNLEKVGGLITFGSPLDKTAFFFREHAGKQEYVRRQIMQQLHSFKARNLTIETDETELSCTIKPLLDAIPWVNYYDAQDPVSGHLDFYQIDESGNHELSMGAAWGVAHTAYWEHRKMYEDIFRRFF